MHMYGKSLECLHSTQVDQSELPFRMLCRRYGATAAYSPMIHSRLYSECVEYREEVSVSLDSRPRSSPLTRDASADLLHLPRGPALVHPVLRQQARDRAQGRQASRALVGPGCSVSSSDDVS